MRKRLIATLMAATGGMLLAIAGLFPLAASAATPTVETVVVTPGDMATSVADVTARPNSWFFYNDENDTIDNSLGSFVNGPATPPAGSGSVEINVSGTQRRNLATYQFSGTKLADITELKFSTYNASATNGGSANRSGYLNFNVDFNGTDTWQKRLVYLPTDNGAVQQDTWQEWDAVNGGNALYRYSGATWPGTATPGTTPRTLSDVISSYSGIRIRVTDSWLGIRVGEPYADGYTENIDKVVFGTASKVTTFDFEAVRAASGAIVKPVENKHYTKTLKLKATYDDGDSVNDDAVQWAVRQGTCAAGTNTVFGNVDGHNDAYQWDGATFTANLDIRSTAAGQYCFIFNPTDDPGQQNVRETRTFYIDAYVPQDKDDCKNNGWQIYTNPSFKNQGQCVKYVNHHDDHGHDGDHDDHHHKPTKKEIKKAVKHWYKYWHNWHWSFSRW